jgi:hypothetical protein
VHHCHYAQRAMRRWIRAHSARRRHSQSCRLTTQVVRGFQHQVALSRRRHNNHIIYMIIFIINYEMISATMVAPQASPLQTSTCHLEKCGFVRAAAVFYCSLHNNKVCDEANVMHRGELFGGKRMHVHGRGWDCRRRTKNDARVTITEKHALRSNAPTHRCNWDYTFVKMENSPHSHWLLVQDGR